MGTSKLRWKQWSRRDVLRWFLSIRPKCWAISWEQAIVRSTPILSVPSTNIDTVVFVLGNRRNWTDLPRLMPLYNLSHTLFWSFCFGITPLAHMELVFLGWIAILGCGWDLGRDDSKRSGKARGEGLITRGKEISLSIHRSCFTIPRALLYSATGWR